MSTLDPELDALRGTTVGGKYRLEESIGRGGMGAVFQATNTAFGKRVALKFLYREAARDRDAVTRFQREAEAASAVESAHIVEIFDSGTTDDGLPFLVMELLKGEDLRARLRREGRLSIPQAVRMGGQVARALKRAHEAGIIHRDLKPDNVFLCRRDDDPMFVKLVDFGISKVTRKRADLDTLTRKGLVLGTAFYMSPEQAQAKPDVDGRTDIFSLGAILFESLAGRPPHLGQAYEAVLISICTQDAPDVREFVPEVPESLARVIAKALCRDREQRYQNAGELYDALASAFPGLLSSGSQISEPFVPVAATGSNSIEPESVSSETAESAAVRPAPASTAGLQTRRTVVTAIVAALAAFTLTVIIMARLAPNQPVGTEVEPRLELGATPERGSTQPASKTVPSVQAVPAEKTPATSGSGSSTPASASAPQAASPTLPQPRQPTRSMALQPIHPKPTPTRERPASDGVANGLQLATEP